MNTIKHFLKHLYQRMSSLSTPNAIIVAALLLSFSHVAYGFVISENNQSATAAIFKGKALDTNDLVTGNPKSDVIVLEYSDTECPYCAQLHPTLKKIQDEYTSKVSFVYRHFPLTQIHPNAFDEARAIYCVGKTSGATKQRDYINQMFSYKLEKKNMTLPQGGKESLAKNIGVDGAALTACLSTPESNDVVNASIEDGVKAGVEGTPATFVLLKKRNGYEVVALIDGARPYEYFKTVLDEALAR